MLIVLSGTGKNWVGVGNNIRNHQTKIIIFCYGNIKKTDYFAWHFDIKVRSFPDHYKKIINHIYTVCMHNSCIEKDLGQMYSHSFFNTIAVISLWWGLIGCFQLFPRRFNRPYLYSWHRTITNLRLELMPGVFQRWMTLISF